MGMRLYPNRAPRRSRGSGIAMLRRFMQFADSSRQFSFELPVSNT